MTTSLVTGANRGIGLEHVKQALAEEESVIATCRSPSHAMELRALEDRYPDRLRIEELDVANSTSVDALTGRLDGTPIDRLINNAGSMGSKEWNPSDDSQSLGSIDYDQWREIMEVNLLGAMRVTEGLLPNVLASHDKIIVMISSGLASIAHNTMGGSHLYRTSKAALNMLARGLAADLEAKGATVLALSPGWTQTDMGGPNAHWTVEQSVTKQREVLGGLTFSDTGKFVELTGDQVPW